MSSGSGRVREAQAGKWCTGDSQAPRPQEQPAKIVYLRSSVSALAEARNHESMKLGEMLCARSIEPFEGGRWRLRRMLRVRRGAVVA
jgi:hypothetical protein